MEITTGWEQMELHLNNQLDIITYGGDKLRAYLHFGLSLNPQRETTWDSVVGMAQFILDSEDWTKYITEAGREALDLIWQTDYHLTIMAKQMDFLTLHFLFKHKYFLKLDLMETIILWGILYLGEEEG